MTTTTTMAEVPGLVGSELGSSDWHEVTQEHVNQFAEATGDHQWIHVDVERATKESPFGGPIGHGYLTLSLLIPMWSEVLEVSDAKMAVNYGLNKVRFPAPGAPRDADALRAALRERLAGFKVPKEVRYVDELPKTATGKIRKPELRNQYAPQEENA